MALRGQEPVESGGAGADPPEPADHRRHGRAGAHGRRARRLRICDAPNGKPAAQIIATGSEVQLAVAAAKALAEEGIGVRVISMPSWDLFDKQARRTAIPCCCRT